MVLGILTAVAACPAIIGTTEAVRQGQKQNAREEQRARRTNLVVTLLNHSSYSPRFNGAYIVLKDNKFWIDVGGVSRRLDLHPFTGYFLPYPGDMAQTWREAGFAKGEGMVTTISDDPPFLNWVYLDRQTHEVKYGVRDQSQPHCVGPWDVGDGPVFAVLLLDHANFFQVTKYDRRLTLEGWEGFVAVEEEEGSPLWALYFDREDDGLASEERVGTQGLRMLALEVWRRELKRDRSDAMEERMDRLRAREEHSSEETTVS